MSYQRVVSASLPSRLLTSLRRYWLRQQGEAGPGWAIATLTLHLGSAITTTRGALLFGDWILGLLIGIGIQAVLFLCCYQLSRLSSRMLPVGLLLTLLPFAFSAGFSFVGLDHWYQGHRQEQELPARQARHRIAAAQDLSSRAESARAVAVPHLQARLQAAHQALVAGGTDLRQRRLQMETTRLEHLLQEWDLYQVDLSRIGEMPEKEAFRYLEERHRTLGSLLQRSMLHRFRRDLQGKGVSVPALGPAPAPLDPEEVRLQLEQADQVRGPFLRLLTGNPATVAALMLALGIDLLPIIASLMGVLCAGPPGREDTAGRGSSVSGRAGGDLVQADRADLLRLFRERRERVHASNLVAGVAEWLTREGPTETTLLTVDERMRRAATADLHNVVATMGWRTCEERLTLLSRIRESLEREFSDLDPDLIDAEWEALLSEIGFSEAHREARLQSLVRKWEQGARMIDNLRKMRIDLAELGPELVEEEEQRLRELFR